MIKNKKLWLKKNLPILIACAGLFAFTPSAMAADDVVRGGGDEESTDDIINNSVEIDSTDGDIANVIGGVSSTGNVEDNTVEINGGSHEGAVGGLTIVNSEAENVAGNVVGNRVIIHGGTVINVSGGEVGYLYPREGDETPDVSKYNFQLGGDVEKNKVEIRGGTIKGNIVGGSALSGSARNNEVVISGGTISGQVIGGMVRYPTAQSEVINNSITIGLDDIQIDGNSINLSDVDLIGGMFMYEGGNLDNIHGNTLKVQNVHGVRVKSISGFDHLNFTLPTEGDVMINVTGGQTTLEDTTIKVGSSGDNGRITDMKSGDSLKINLIQNDNNLKLKNITLDGPFMDGHSIKREITLLTDDDETIAVFNNDNLAKSAAIDSDGFLTTNGFHAKVGDIIGLDENADKLSNTGVINNHTAENIIQNAIKDWKPPEEEFREIQDEDVEVGNEMKIFAGGNGNALRVKLSDGGHIRNNVVGLGLGGAKTLVNKGNGNHFSFAPLVDHGKGKFDTYTADGKHGKGDTQFSGGGFIARRMLTNGFYYEGSLHYGRAKSSFESNDFKPDANDSTYDTYDMSAPIIAGHINIGKLFAINRENTVHVYGQYLHSHQGSMSTNLLNGDHYEFDSINDGSFIAGVRFINQPNKVNKFYSGFAYQYDHSSGSSAVCKGQRTHEVDSNGSSGMFELGWELKPHAAIPWVVDLGAIGWIGQQKGLTFHAKVKKSF